MNILESPSGVTRKIELVETQIGGEPRFIVRDQDQWPLFVSADIEKATKFFQNYQPSKGDTVLATREIN